MPGPLDPTSIGPPIASSRFTTSGLGSALTSTSNFTNTPESQQGANLLRDRLRGPRPLTETVVIHSDTRTVDDPAFKAVVEQTATDLLGLKSVVSSATTYYQAAA